jgi:hypothetical protein
MVRTRQASQPALLSCLAYAELAHWQQVNQRSPGVTTMVSEDNNNNHSL